ncbi:MAG: glutamyl-tRNA reductase [Arenicella sp.]
MSLLSLGLSHHTAPVDVREQVAVPDHMLEDALADLTNYAKVDEASIVSTCNRTEIYCRQDQPDFSKVSQWLCHYTDLKSTDLEPYIYTLPNEQAVRHAFRVATGLDSMVLGESQILGQMKTAFATAHKTGRTGKILNHLFQQTFSVAKQVRTDTSIGSSPVSVAYAAVSLAKQIFADLGEQTVLMIGAGDTIELAIKHLHQQGVTKCIIANRSRDRANRLAEQFAAQAISLDELHERLPEADIVFSSTASSLPILGKGAIETALQKRKNRSMFLVDLAVPRDIEPQIADLNNVYLYTVDHLRDVINENLNNRKSAALDAEKIVDEKTLAFMNWMNRLDYVPTIRALREYTQDMTDRELQRALKRLDAGDQPHLVLTQFAHALSQKIMHEPSKKLNQTDNDQLIAAISELFNLHKNQ